MFNWMSQSAYTIMVIEICHDPADFSEVCSARVGRQLQSRGSREAASLLVESVVTFPVGRKG
jgi:hypothetical protein